MKRVIELLTKYNKTISTMESCTGGAIVNAITNIPGASDVIKFSAITYSNEYKIKMGVSKELIDKYTVYSREVAMDMAKTISNYTGSSYGVGITGKLKKIDKNNLYGENDVVHLAIYDKENNKYYYKMIKLQSDNRISCKEEIINVFIEEILNIL